MAEKKCPVCGNPMSKCTCGTAGKKGPPPKKGGGSRY